MSRFCYLSSLGLLLLSMAACHRQPAVPAPAAANAVAPNEQLSRIVERYWDEHASLGDALSAQFLADSLAVERAALAEVLAVPRARLDAQSKLSYDIFRRERELAVEGFTYPTELMPIQPFDSKLLGFAHRAAETAHYPLVTPKDYERWLQQIDDVARWNEQAIVNMRDGLRRGYASPKVLIERSLPLLEKIDEDTSGNVFYIPLRTMPDSIKEPERSRLGQRLGATVKDKLLPSIRALHDFLAREYVPRARAGIALSALPLGGAWYGYRVRRATDSLLTPNEIHNLGVAEVERIRARLQALQGSASTAATSTAATAPTGAAAPDSAPQAGTAIAAAVELKAQTTAALPRLFGVSPQADFEILAADPFLTTAGPMRYQRSAPDAGTPAILYVDLRRAAAQPNAAAASLLTEAIPGRHFQSTVAQERNDLPRFRRFDRDLAFVDGWGLYAAMLGEDLGVYSEESKKAALLTDLGCAVGLVVDTGLHAKEWPRSQALDYLRTQLALDDVEANLWVDRYAAFPADALACKMGAMKIQALRARAQQVLGSRFELRDFHDEILKDGAMPLDILDAKLKLWMDAQ